MNPEEKIRNEEIYIQMYNDRKKSSLKKFEEYVKSEYSKCQDKNCDGFTVGEMLNDFLDNYYLENETLVLCGSEMRSLKIQIDLSLLKLAGNIVKKLEFMRKTNKGEPVKRKKQTVFKAKRKNKLINMESKNQIVTDNTVSEKEKQETSQQSDIISNFLKGVEKDKNRIEEIRNKIKENNISIGKLQSENAELEKEEKDINDKFAILNEYISRGNEKKVNQDVNSSEEKRKYDVIVRGDKKSNLYQKYIPKIEELYFYSDVDEYGRKYLDANSENFYKILIKHYDDANKYDLETTKQHVKHNFLRMAKGKDDLFEIEYFENNKKVADKIIFLFNERYLEKVRKHYKLPAANQLSADL
jgi:hypothetical protein